jgi:hypothetical protein
VPDALTLSAVGVEALDDPATDPALVQRMLRDIARSNRWLGGGRAARHGLAQLLGPGDRGATLTLLDIGTGAGDLPHTLTRWAARRGVTLHGIGVERLPAAAALAHDGGLPTMLACGGTLPLADRSVDLVLASQLAHHLDADGTIALCREAARVARRGVILADLRPSPLGALGYRLAGPLLGFHPMTISDGVLSLARGRDAASLAALATRAGARDVLATSLPCARVVIAWRTAS